ncbi:MAG: hypothetical protein CVU56_17225, partial [Deltaproteobacteria bacterium HGW-Deltaproteobacteria-14]
MAKKKRSRPQRPTDGPAPPPTAPPSEARADAATSKPPGPRAPEVVIKVASRRLLTRLPWLPDALAGLVLVLAVAAAPPDGLARFPGVWLAGRVLIALAA